MFQLGLKLWSTDIERISQIGGLRETDVFQYIELTSVPGSFHNTAPRWSDLGMPFFIHAAHYSLGMNLADPSMVAKNRGLAIEAFLFADALQSPLVIFHAGVNGTLDETIRQLSSFNDKRVCIENKPYYGLGKELCVGYSPVEIARVMDRTGASFCLDLGHAICAANALETAPLLFIGEFLDLHPSLFHLTDGDFTGRSDRHEHFGAGNFPLAELLHMIPDGSRVTNEAKHDSLDNLSDYERDVDFLRSLINTRSRSHHGNERAN